MQADSSIPPNQERTNVNEPSPADNSESKLVRLRKTIIVNSKKGEYVDGNVVAYRYYNSFNYSLLRKEHQGVNLTIGITSANPGEGKTLVASNLAVSLATGYQKRTILVDLNMQHPRLHDIFDIDLQPGLYEAFKDGTIQVSQTKIEYLSVLAAGGPVQLSSGGKHTKHYSARSSYYNPEPPVGLEYFAAFRDIIYSLEQDFEFVIVDMPSIHPHGFPTLFANQLQGLLVVVGAGTTKRGEIDHIFRYLNEHQVLGFVFNRVKHENLSKRQRT
jgi:Mrp family chromosome partitioning ATPase